MSAQRALVFEINKELGLRLPTSKSKPRNVLEQSRKKLKKILSDYGRVYSLICGNVIDGEDLFSCLDPHFSIMVSEVRACQEMKKFRQLFDKIVIYYLEKLTEGMDQIIAQHSKVSG